MEAREQRGLIIAAKCRIQAENNLWNVPSQTPRLQSQLLHGRPEGRNLHLPGPYGSGHRCKHLFAVQFVIEREYSDDGMVLTEKESLTVQTVRKTYRQDWRNYNLAQTNEKAKFQMLLRGLCDGIEGPKQIGRGCRRVPLDDAIFSAVFKVYSTVSGRRFMCDLAMPDKSYIKRDAVLQHDFPHSGSRIYVASLAGADCRKRESAESDRDETSL